MRKGERENGISGMLPLRTNRETKKMSYSDAKLCLCPVESFIVCESFRTDLV